jgi:hypothetical protein
MSLVQKTYSCEQAVPPPASGTPPNPAGQPRRPPRGLRLPPLSLPTRWPTPPPRSCRRRPPWPPVAAPSGAAVARPTAPRAGRPPPLAPPCHPAPRRPLPSQAGLPGQVPGVVSRPHMPRPRGTRPRPCAPRGAGSPASLGPAAPVAFPPPLPGPGRRPRTGSGPGVARTGPLLRTAQGPGAWLPRSCQRRAAHRRACRTARPIGRAPRRARAPPAHPHGATSWPSLAPEGGPGALATRRLVSLQDRLGTGTERQPGSTRPRTTPRDVLACRRRVLPHGRPSGCMQVRPGGLRSARWAIHPPDSRPSGGAPRRAAGTIPPARRLLSAWRWPPLWRGAAGPQAGAPCSGSVWRYGLRSGQRA